MLKILIPAKGKPNTTNRAITSLCEHVRPHTPFELHVRVETEDQELQPLYDSWRSLGAIIHEGQPLPSFAAATNELLPSLGEADILGLVNSDTYVDADPITPMLRHFNESRVAVVGCKLLYARSHGYPKGTIQHAGNVYGLMRTKHRVAWQHLGLGQASEDHRECKVVPAVTFAFALLRVDVLRSRFPTPDGLMAGLDEGFAWEGGEDADYCTRVTQGGYRVVCCCEGRAWHYEGLTRGPQPEGDFLEQDRFSKRWLKTLFP